MESQEVLGAGIAIAMLLIYVLVVVGFLFLAALVAWKITAKTGYPGVLGLLYFVPIANIVLLLILAFSEWPVHREMKSLKEVLGRQAGPINANDRIAGVES